jgi:hypothetical protein
MANAPVTVAMVVMMAMAMMAMMSMATMTAARRLSLRGGRREKHA